MPTPQLAGLVLAAGGAKRLGGGKLLLPWKGQPIINHVLNLAAASGCLQSLTVILGDRATEMRQAISRTPPSIPFILQDNPAWEEGQSTSLKQGIACIAANLKDDSIQGVIVLLGDQPQVKPNTLSRLAHAHAEVVAIDPTHPASAPYYQGRRGNPVILSPCLFPLIQSLSGDVGARHILESLGQRLLCLEVDDSGILTDIDTPEDYRRIRERAD